MEQGEKLKGGIFITPKDIMALRDCSPNTAKTEHRTIRDILGIKHRRLTIAQYAEYYDIGLDLIIMKLNDSRGYK